MKRAVALKRDPQVIAGSSKVRHILGTAEIVRSRDVARGGGMGFGEDPLSERMICRQTAEFPDQKIASNIIIAWLPAFALLEETSEQSVPQQNLDDRRLPF